MQGLYLGRSGLQPGTGVGVFSVRGTQGQDFLERCHGGSGRPAPTAQGACGRGGLRARAGAVARAGARADPGGRGPLRRPSGGQGGGPGAPRARCCGCAANRCRTSRAAGSSWRTPSILSRSTCAGWRRWTSARRRADSPTACCSGGPAASTASTSGTASSTGRSPRTRAWWSSTAPTSATCRPSACPSAAHLPSSTYRSSRCAWCCRPCRALLVPGAPAVVLVKPQFEVGRERGRQGRDRS